MTSFLQSLVTQAEPRFAMFGPGLEELDDSLVQKMMTCPEILLVAGLPQRQIHGNAGFGVRLFCFVNRYNTKNIGGEIEKRDAFFSSCISIAQCTIVQKKSIFSLCIYSEG